MALCRMPRKGDGIRKASDGTIWNVIAVDEHGIVYFDERIRYGSLPGDTEWNCFIGSFREPIWCPIGITNIISYETVFNKHLTFVG